jgi:hypothetical protein
VDDSATTREDQLAALASHFAYYVEQQTGAVLIEPSAAGPAGLLSAVAQLDEALGQLADLASVYGTDPRADLEAFTLPAAALIGAYLHQATGATWVGPEIEADTTVLIAMPNGLAVDLTGFARATLLSGLPNFSALLQKLLAEPESEPS